VPQCLNIYKKWPKLNLNFIIDDRDNRLNFLKQGIADIVVLYPHQVTAELTSKLVKPDEYLLLGHPNWKNRELKEIIETERLFAFHADDNTSLNYLKSFNLLKYLRRPRLFVNENLALSALLRSGAGFGLLSKEVAEPFLKEKSLITLNEGKSMKDPIAIAWYYRKETPPYLKDIIRSIR
jgi:DNA-binding transcriptional LysR family regulator